MPRYFATTLQSSTISFVFAKLPGGYTSPVESPYAPALMASSTRSFISLSSFGLGALLWGPSTAVLTAPCPTRVAMLWPTPLVSSLLRYSAKGLHFHSFEDPPHAPQ